MTPHTTDERPPTRRSRLWSVPIVRAVRRKSRLAPTHAVPRGVAESDVDDGEDLLRRLREAGL
jgi:hypothetical protein